MPGKGFIHQCVGDGEDRGVRSDPKGESDDGGSVNPGFLASMRAPKRRLRERAFIMKEIMGAHVCGGRLFGLL
jgi:hypothetical protein